MESGYDFIRSGRARLDEHTGKWIAVVGEGIVASGDDFKEVHEKATAEYPKEIPLIMKVPKEPVMLL